MGDCLRAGKSSRYEARSTQPSTLRGMVNEYQLLGRVVINGDGECSTTATSLGGSEAEAGWLGPKIGGCLTLVLRLSNKPGELSALNISGALDLRPMQ